ncbi:hypothetical protein [Winogradskyella immobilis]|uniref:Uncharacterized protein n=1 Tax=Winogradskyella immobilis TaxID=2816852 RepID=A0ABS8ER38_9FLAO|nr:hypothetical protein [Winogradskyella immobilis]MCC1485317.1 hypothetical protein [Winogradskyella immobilis]MCG0017409.1 hypothetical protein [Winogradskyella immobilis]
MKKLSFIFLMLFSITLFANNSNPLVKKDLNPETNIDSIEIVDPTEICDCKFEITEKDDIYVASCWGTATNMDDGRIIRTNSTGFGTTRQEAIDNCYKNVQAQLEILIIISDLRD